MAESDIEILGKRVRDVLRTVFDPEIPVNIFELGLIHDIDISPEYDVAIRMTLTSPACPVAETLPAEVQQKIEWIDTVRSAKVDIVWDPPWSMDRMSEAARLQLGLV
jgi:FeS assembly SUF system protein